jgi:hypothetical protein
MSNSLYYLKLPLCLIKGALMYIIMYVFYEAILSMFDKKRVFIQQVNVANTSIELSKQNINRFARILFPPKPEVLSNMCKQGFDDALRFLQRNNMISCTRCLAVQSTFQLQDVLDDTINDFDPDCEECKTHRQVRSLYCPLFYLNLENLGCPPILCINLLLLLACVFIP